MSDDPRWNEPASAMLCAGEVHVWRAPLDVAAPVAERLIQLLGDAEHARARRFVRPADGRRFAVARGLLRTIVASYLGRSARELRFAYGAHGKPALMPPAGAAGLPTDLTFSVSHSGALALVAIAAGRQVGIDVEELRADVAIDAIARRFFSPHEVTMLESIEPRRRPAAFYRAWTSKEAYLKARGVGLSGRLDAFDVSLRPDEPAALLAHREDPAEVSGWTLMTLPVEPEHAAALAVEGRPGRIRLREWRPAPT